MKILVCGGRNYAERDTVAWALDAYRSDRLEIIHGGASGADQLAHDWATANCVPVHVFKADWIRHGRAAGPIRNQEMIDRMRPDAVLAFPGGRGTADMLRRARAAGINVVEVAARPTFTLPPLAPPRRGL
jgi:hypothetical protein